MGTTVEKLAKLQQTKSDIKDAIVNKGVSVPTDATFASYAEYIGQISGGGGEEPTGNIELTASTSDRTGLNVKPYASATVHPTPSETKTVTANGTYTPTSGKFFSSVTVNLDVRNYITGSGDPSASIGSDGDLYFDLG